MELKIKTVDFRNIKKPPDLHGDSNDVRKDQWPRQSLRWDLVRNLENKIYFGVSTVEDSCNWGSIRQSQSDLLHRKFNTEKKFTLLKRANQSAHVRCATKYLIEYFSLLNSQVYSIENSTDSQYFGRPFICLKTPSGSIVQPRESLPLGRTQQMSLSMSHCDNLATIAFSPHSWIEVGIDIEKVVKRSRHFAQWAFGEYEKIQLNEILVSNPTWTDLILNMGWAVKEAIAKMTGRGLVDALKNSRVEFKNIPIQLLIEFVSTNQSLDLHLNSIPHSFESYYAERKIKIHLQLLKIKSELYVLSLAHVERQNQGESSCKSI